MFFSCFHVLIDRSHRINALLTVYWKYHSSVVVLSLVPTALVAIQQQTRDISQYTVNNIYLSRSLVATCTACNLHAVYIDDCTLPVCIIICTQKYNMYIEQLDICTIMYNYSHTTYNRCTHEYKSIHNTVLNYGEGNDMGGY